LLAAATGAAVWAARETGGLVDPTLGHSLAAAGYDRDYDAVRLDDGPAAIPVPAIIGAWQEVRADPAGAVLVPAGTALDLGATGKAFAADLIAAAISAHTGAGCVLSLGGDVAVGRADATGDGAGDGAGDTVPWRVAIAETPQDPPAAMVTLASGGLATSTTLTRRWHRGGQVVHHLLDPATGRSVEALWRTVSVAGPTCLEANTASTAAVVIGARATEWLAARGVAARLVDAEGAVTYAGGWTEEAM
jgi:thiamine biosynthesis lipoprotein